MVQTTSCARYEYLAIKLVAANQGCFVRETVHRCVGGVDRRSMGGCIWWLCVGGKNGKMVFSAPVFVFRSPPCNATFWTGGRKQARVVPFRHPRF